MQSIVLIAAMGLLNESTSASIKDIDVESIETGQPVEGYLYHGSSKDNFDELSPRHPHYPGSLGWGLYLAEKDEAEYYGKHIYRVFVSMKKPFVLEPQDPTEFDWEKHNTTFAKAYVDSEWSPEMDIQWTDAFHQANEINERGKLKNFYEWLKGQGSKEAFAYYKRFVQFVREDRSRTADDWFETEGDHDLADDVNDAMKDDWPGNIRTPLLPDSILVGEQVPPFVYEIGDKFHLVLDRSDLEDISDMVREAGYDAVVVHGLRINAPTPRNHEVAIFNVVQPDQIDGKPISKET